MKVLIRLLVLVTIAVNATGTESRGTTDHEIAAAEEALRSAATSARRIGAHLNLGDLRTLRAEMDLAIGEYRAAERLAGVAARQSRLRSDLEGYSRATAYRGIALAKLGDRSGAFEALEEAIRYQSDSARIWNHYAWAMSMVDLPAKAEAAARNAVTLAEEQAGTDSAAGLLDLAIYRYALAGALLATDPVSGEAADVLHRTRETLVSPRFDRIRARIAKDEAFEIFSFVGNDTAAWLSLYNRVHLRLGALLEERGEIEDAREAYRGVLTLRSDDPKALAALARLASAETDRDRWFAESFAANPFAPSTILAYESHARSSAEPDFGGDGGRVQRALWLLDRGRTGEARAAVQVLAIDHPRNASVFYLHARLAMARGNVDEALALVTGAPAPLRDAIARQARQARAGEAERARLIAAVGGGMRDPSPELLRAIARAFGAPDADAGLRAALDDAVFSTIASMDPAVSHAEGVTIFQSGAIGPIRFRFSVPTAFHGSFDSGPARITFRVSGATGDALLIEPLALEPR